MIKLLLKHVHVLFSSFLVSVCYFCCGYGSTDGSSFFFRAMEYGDISFNLSADKQQVKRGTMSLVLDELENRLNGLSVRLSVRLPVYLRRKQ